MKCPECGCEIAEGHLYCESCGMEIRIVPDFEPEIENSITETLSTVAEEIERKSPDASPTKKDSPKQNLLPVILTIFLVVLVMVIIAGVLLYQRYSVSYQIGQARKSAEEQNYEQAAEFMDRARHLAPDNADVALLEAGYLISAGDADQALSILLGLVDRIQLEYGDKEKVFENIVAIYSDRGQFEQINSLLLASGDLEIQNHFQQYMAMTPEFGYESGTYEEVLQLRMSANTSGKIYYTLDGSMPDEHSLLYTAPLTLETGDFQIFAIFINDYGIKSDVARGMYTINLTVPDPPDVLVPSGDYQLPTMIEVQAPEDCTVYYTTDRSAPSADSLRYTEPIFMPLGRTNYKFIAISEQGVSSEVVSRSYRFELETEVTIDKAIRNVVQALFNRRVLSDQYGHSTEIQGKYVFEYDTIVEIPNLGYYYKLNEYVEDEYGNRTQTERLYAVEVYTGSPNRLTYDENGEMGLIALGDQ